LQVGLETVFNNLDAARTFHSAFKVTRGRHLQEPARLIDALNEVVPGLLGETISGECAYHTALAESLQIGDAVLSLNYDCVIDTALARHAGYRFDPLRRGYGIEVSSIGASTWRRASGRGRRSPNSILLLKLHGSLNWRSRSVPLRLRRDPYTPVSVGVIAPPMTNKPVTEEPFATIWKEARRAVGRMRRLILIGYSMPQADGLVRTLLTTDLSASLQEVLVVDPSEETVAKHVNFFARLAPRARVFTFASMRQMGSLLQK